MPPSSEFFNTWRHFEGENKSDEVTRGLADQDSDGKKILENILKYREMFMFWSDYSEKSFLESRL